MIVSASYKTDIQAFYGNWFMHRLAAGYCLVHNSYTDQPFRVSLERKDVDGFVFWTKNPGPFIEQLGRVQELGYPFVLQFTITGYPRLIESHVITAESAIALARKVGTRFGLRTSSLALRPNPLHECHYRGFPPS